MPPVARIFTGNILLLVNSLANATCQGVVLDM